MATQTRQFFAMNAGQCIGTYSYDDVSLRMTNVTVTNTGQRGTVTYEIFDVDTGALVTSGAVLVGDQPKVFNLFPANILMRQPGPDGDQLWPPFTWHITWSLA